MSIPQHHLEHHQAISQQQREPQQEVVTLNDAISNVDVVDALELPDSQPCVTGQYPNSIIEFRYYNFPFPIQRRKLVHCLSRQFRYEFRRPQCICLRSRQVY